MESGKAENQEYEQRFGQINIDDHIYYYWRIY